MTRLNSLLLSTNLLLFPIVLSAFSSAVLAKLNAPPDIKKIKAKKTLKVGMYFEDQVPFFQKVNGKLEGFDIDFAKKIAETMNVSVKFDRSAKTFDEIIEKVNAGEVDIGLSKISRRPKRALYVNFTRPYFEIPTVLILNRKKTTRILNQPDGAVEKLNSPKIRIGVLKSSSFERAANEEFSRAKIIPLKNEQALFESVLEGEVHAIVADKAEMIHWEKKRADIRFKAKMIPFKSLHEYIGIAVNWNQPQLLRFLNLVIENWEKDGILEGLKRKYFDEDEI